MKKTITIVALVFLLSLVAFGCTSQEKPVPSLLEASSLQNGSVALYSIKDKNGKVMKLIKNHVLEETSQMFFIQEYSASDSEEMIRVKLSPKTLNLDYSEVVVTKSTDGGESMPKQEASASIERAGSNYFLTMLRDGKKQNTRIFNDSLVMEQEVMVYLLNCFPFDKTSSASIHFMNVRSQQEGVENITVVGKETKMYNQQNINVYRVKLDSLGCTAWYMEEKPHPLVEADFPSYTIQLSDWNGR